MPRIITESPGISNRNGKWKHKEIKIATLQIFSFYRAGVCQSLVDILNNYNVSVAESQEVKWTRTGQIKVIGCVIYYKGLDDTQSV